MADGDMKKTACVTGGNGYIASALIKMLLEKGYAVKTTVRNPDDMEKNSHLKDLQALGSLEVFRADLDEDGSFDDAVAGCDYAFLVAAPVILHTKNPEKELIEPAVRGTLNVMRSCVKARTVRRVVLTSSAAAAARRRARSGRGLLVRRRVPQSSQAFRALGTSYVARQPLQLFGDDEKLRTTALLDVLACIAGVPGVQGAPGEGGVQVRGGAPHQPRHRLPRRHRRRGAGTQGDEAEFAVLDAIERATGCVPLVHVDDLCRAELFVAEEDAAAGRYICCGLNTTIAEVARFLADKYPQYGVKTNLLSGERLQKPRVRLSSEKLVKEGFEFRYRTLDDMYDDMVEYGKTLGILPS